MIDRNIADDPLRASIRGLPAIKKQPPSDAWKKWVERRVSETTYRPDPDGHDQSLFEAGFNAAKEATGMSSASTVNAQPSVKLG